MRTLEALERSNLEYLLNVAKSLSNAGEHLRKIVQYERSKRKHQRAKIKKENKQRRNAFLRDRYNLRLDTRVKSITHEHAN